MKYSDFIVSPLDKSKLRKVGNKLYDNSGNSFKIVKGVPILLPKKYVADWHRELIEVILWEYPDEIDNLYNDIDWKIAPVDTYVKYIERILNNKQGILDAIDRYSKSNTEQWIINKNKVISQNQKEKFNKYSKKSNGKSRTISKIEAKGIFTPYPYFSEIVNRNLPKTIVELGTGAGGGTASIGLNMDKNSILFSVDIGYECLGNAVGIRKFQKKNIIPICANFWYLPFKDDSVDSVCTFNGFDESREVNKTIKEAFRILKNNGIFTVASRKNAYMRQSFVLNPFGFTENETIELLDKCRIYTNVENLCKLCNENKMILDSIKEFEIKDDLTIVITQFKKARV